MFSDFAAGLLLDKIYVLTTIPMREAPGSPSAEIPLLYRKAGGLPNRETLKGSKNIARG